MIDDGKLQRSLLIIPMLTLSATVYVACSSEDVDTQPFRASVVQEAGDVDSGTETGTTVEWPDAAEDVIEDAEDDGPVSGGG